jgi:hypothetical protein
MSYMTKIEGVPDTDDAKGGIAYFAGTGPEGATCGKCRYRGSSRQSTRGEWSEKLQRNVYRTYRTAQCAMFRKLAGRNGAPVKKTYAACKYFESKDKA